MGMASIPHVIKPHGLPVMKHLLLRVAGATLAAGLEGRHGVSHC